MICEQEKCTGCGMCVNICPNNALEMKIGFHDFFFPVLNEALCTNCGLCKKKCPVNMDINREENVKAVYAAWSKNKSIRHNSTSGGIFPVLAKEVIKKGGVVAGVSWNDDFHPQHVLIEKEENLYKLQGSKYSQSNTADIYRQIKTQLEIGKFVLFSGTPCQNSALRNYLGRVYENLFLVDVVCHGVPSNAMLDRYYEQFDGKIKSVRLRKKDPYWDYSYVELDFENKPSYQSLTIDDSFFNLFNIGYSLRECCHNCQYANTHRYSDITLADYWGYRAHSFKTRNYNKGTSLLLINSDKGMKFIESIKDSIFIEKSNIENAKKGNKCLSESFIVDSTRLTNFWKDYLDGLTINELNNKYAANTYSLPHFINLKRIYYKWRWIIGR